MSERLVPISIGNILVGFDGSEHSKKAAELSVDLAVKWNAELYLIHVLEEKETVLPEAYREYAKVEHVDPSAYFDSIYEFLQPVEDRARAAGIKKLERINAWGHPAEEILKAAQEHNADVIILGCRGHGKFPRAFLGGVATKVLTHANCSCIIVK
ncbi:MAG TPA: universal stress protein [Methylomirabilota bacterium]|nr:universal stress protein [Methylomirabilota bacterium]